MLPKHFETLIKSHKGTIHTREFPTRCGNCHLIQALTIAWEALEYGFNGRTIKAPGMSVQDRPLSNSEIRLSLEKAMRRIEEIGKEGA